MIARYGEENWPSLRPGYALYSTQSPTYHAMLIAAAEVQNPEQGAVIEVFHMAPPLEVTGRAMWNLEKAGVCWVGWSAEIPSGMYQSICDEVERIESSMPPTAAPPAMREQFEFYDLGCHGITEESINEEGEEVVVRCSCASFVEHCYQTIEFDLVDEATVPSVSLEDMVSILAQNGTHDENKLKRRFATIERMIGRPLADWPCPVLLPAYQMRAFKEENYPRKPSLADHPFP